MSLRRFFQRAKWDRERQRELDSYLQIEIEDNAARGMTRNEAVAAAHRKLGNYTRIREEIYHMNTVSVLDALSRDVRYALRGLRRNPMFTAVALLTLAIGIGANTAVFSVVNSVLLKPLDYPKSEQLVGVWHAAPGAPGMASVSGDLSLSSSMYFTYSDQNRSFQSFGVWVPATSAVTGLAEPEQVRTALVSDGVLQALAVPPAIGRWLGHDDQIPGGRITAVLGFGYWQRRFGGERSVIGRTISVNANSVEIVGVMPRVSACWTMIRS